MKRVFAMDRDDNVATVLEPVAAGEEVEIIGEQSGIILAGTDIPDAHKIALSPIPRGTGVFKLATRIGTASKDVVPGEWVHLQNLQSDYDQRSDGADLKTGQFGDVSYG